MLACLSPAVDAVDGAVRAVLADDGLVADPERLVGDVESLLDSRTRLLASTVRRLREADRCEAIARVTGRTTRDWLVQEMRLTRAEACRLMLLVGFLDQFPATEAALHATRIGFDHAVAIVRALLRLRDVELRGTVEEHLIGYAAEYPPSELAGFVDALLERLGYDKDSDPRREHKLGDRGLGLTRTFAGNTVLDATLTPDGAAIVAEALRVAGEQRSDDDERTQRQRDHDSFVEIAREWLAQREVQPSFAGTPVGVIVSVPLDVLEQRLTAATAHCCPPARRSAPTPPGASPATRHCSPSPSITAPTTRPASSPEPGSPASTGSPRSSATGGPAATSPPTSAAPPTSNNTAGARSPAAAAASSTATTSSGADGAAVAPSTTPPGSAPSTTGSSTKAAGHYAATPTAASPSPAPPAPNTPDIPRRHSRPHRSPTPPSPAPTSG